MPGSVFPDDEDERESHELEKAPRYTGKKRCCAMCERPFKVGDVVHVNEKEDLVFCYDASGESVQVGDVLPLSCWFKWMMENSTATLLVGMVYAGPNGA